MRKLSKITIQKQLIKCLSFVLCLCFHLSLFANGASVDVSFFRKTGNVRLLKKADIALLKEDLSLKVVGDYTIVKVRYTFKNNGKAEPIYYGFPVDVFDGCRFFILEPIDSTEYDLFKAIEYFAAWENKKPLKVNSWISDSLYTVKDDFCDKLYIHRKWFITKIQFNKNETKILEIEYKIENTKDDHLRGYYYLPRSRQQNFTYHLFPSSKWGDGIVNDFSVTIDLSDIDKDGGTYKISGLDMDSDSKDIFHYSAKNYNLKQSDRINISYEIAYKKTNEFAKRRRLKNTIVKRITASSDAANIKNLIDSNPNTVWTGKTGDWIEIEFYPTISKNSNDTVYVMGFLSLNGNYTTKKLFEQLGKIKNCEITINDTVEYIIDPWGERNITSIELPLSKYVQSADKEWFAEIIADIELYRYNARKMRLTITDVYSGSNSKTKFAISEIYFVGYQKSRRNIRF